jgi:hypothetical protein
MEEMDIQLFFLAPITPANFTSKNTDFESTTYCPCCKPFLPVITQSVGDD